MSEMVRPSPWVQINIIEQMIGRGSFELLLCLWSRWVGPVPDSRVVVATGRHHYGSHDGGDVESRPDGHELVDQVLLLEVLVASFLEPILHGHSAGVVQGVWVVPVVVGLHNEPVGLAQLVESMHGVSVTLDHTALVLIYTSDDIVDWTTDSLGFNSSDCRSVASLLLQGLPEQPASRHAIVDEDTDQVIIEMLGFSGVDIDGEGAVPDAGEGENRSHNSINTEQLLIIFVVLDIDHKFGQDIPHLEIEVAPMHDLAG